MRTRTVVHRFEIGVGGGAGCPKRLEDFVPQAAAHVGMQRKEVYHECQKRGGLTVLMQSGPQRS